MLKEGSLFSGLSVRARKLLLPAVVLVLLYFITPLILTSAATCLIRRDSVQSADVVVALGGDSRCLREREAAEIYRRGMARKVVVSGIPYAWGFDTGEAARQYLISLGVPEADVFVLRRAWNTRVEADLLAQLMRERGLKSAIVVTDPFHSRRALHTIERAASDLTFYSSPVPPGPTVWRPERWWARRGDMYLTVREGIAWANTLLGGLR
ncbi:MAG TPA: YdcF family protein [Blastocatellia bacterium]|nr:YdcF family protein [Blastocatellia bacterium]